MSRDDYAEEAIAKVGYDRTERRHDGLGERQDRLSKEQAQMDESLDLLSERLGPILGPERPSPALARLDPSEDTGAPLTRFLEHVTTREQAMVERLRHLIDRIDL